MSSAPETSAAVAALFFALGSGRVLTKTSGGMMKATKVEHVAPMRPRMTPRSRTTAATSHVPARNDSVKPATYLRRSGGPVAASLSLAPASTPKEPCSTNDRNESRAGLHMRGYEKLTSAENPSRDTTTASSEPG